MSLVAERLRFIRYWMDQTGETEIDMIAVTQMAMSMGWKAPPPTTAEERLTKLFKDAARHDVRHDRKTGHPYKGYHAVPKYTADGQQVFSYIDIDDPKTKPSSFRKACVTRREQTIDDQVGLRLDQLHWNDNRPPAQQIDLLPADLEFDVELRLASMGDNGKRAA